MCVVGIGEGGNASAPCVTVTGTAHAPQGDMTVVQFSPGTVAVMGWAFDHADLHAQIPVGVIIDGGWHGGVSADLPSADLRPCGVPGSHAFLTGAALTTGRHTACGVVASPRTGPQTTVGCMSFTVTR